MRGITLKRVGNELSCVVAQQHGAIAPARILAIGKLFSCRKVFFKMHKQKGNFRVAHISPPDRSPRSEAPPNGT